MNTHAYIAGYVYAMWFHLGSSIQLGKSEPRRRFCRTPSQLAKIGRNKMLNSYAFWLPLWPSYIQISYMRRHSSKYSYGDNAHAGFCTSMCFVNICWLVNGEFFTWSNGGWCGISPLPVGTLVASSSMLAVDCATGVACCELAALAKWLEVVLEKQEWEKKTIESSS